MSEFAELEFGDRLPAGAGEGINTDAGNEQEALFSLAALRGKGSLADLAEVSAPADHEMEEFEADSDTNAAQPGEQDSADDDSDEEERCEVSSSLHWSKSCTFTLLPYYPIMMMLPVQYST